MALVGNFRNFLTSVESISTLGFQNGIVKYVTENKNDKYQLNKIFSTLFFTLVGLSVLLGCILFLFANKWNTIVFGDNLHYSFIFKALAVALPWYISSIFLIAIINGLGKFKQVIYINIYGNIIGLLVTIFLIVNLKTFGALLSIIITPSLLFLVTFYIFSKSFSLVNSIKLQFFDFGIIKNLSHYFIMVLASGIFGSIVFLAIRNYIIAHIGLKEAGFCETMSRFSTYYMLFVNTLLTLYYYPQLVLANSTNETRAIFLDFFKYVLSLFGLGLIVIYFLRLYIIRILFSQQFEPVADLFLWQLIGDFLKAASWILGLQFFAKKMTKAFIVTEVLSLTTLYFSSIYLVNNYKMEGVVMAHAFTYFLYLLVLAIYFRKSLV
jgi:PST family polysaccharide transporter